MGNEGAVVELDPGGCRGNRRGSAAGTLSRGTHHLTNFPLGMGRGGRGEGSGREKSLPDGVGHGIGDVLDVVSLLGGDVEAYTCFRFPIAG